MSELVAYLVVADFLSRGLAIEDHNRLIPQYFFNIGLAVCSNRRK
jgi:hypothetical protein